MEKIVYRTSKSHKITMKKFKNKNKKNEKNETKNVLTGTMQRL